MSKIKTQDFLKALAQRAGVDVDFVIETMRGHNLGRIINEGMALPNTGTPGLIAGYGKERVVHAGCEGRLHNLTAIGDMVEKDQAIATIAPADGGQDYAVRSPLKGLLRGLIRDGFYVTKGLKTCPGATDDEEDMLDTARAVTTESRLSCQCVPDGSEDVEIVIPKWNKNLVKEGH